MQFRSPLSFAGSLIVLLGGMAIPSSAWALDTNSAYDVFLFQENVEYPVGTMTFSFDAESTGRCQYAVEWDSGGPVPLSGQCLVNEFETWKHDACFDNFRVSFDTLVTLDATSVGGACAGFDRFQQIHPIQDLIALETDEGLEGLIRFEGDQEFSRLIARPAAP